MPRNAIVSSLAAVAMLGAVLATAPAASATSAAAIPASALSLDPSYTPTVTLFGSTPLVSRAVVAKDGSAYIAGEISDVDGQPRTGVAHLLADGSLDPNFTTVGSGLNTPEVDSMVVQPDGKVILGGEYMTYDGQPVTNVVRLNSDGTLDTTFNPPNLAGRANGLALQPDGKILVGLSSGAPVRLNSDGTLDNTFAATMTPQTGVYSFAVMPDGDIYIAGAWSYLNGVEWRFGLARLNSDGSTDFGFNPRTQVTAGYVFGLHAGPKGKVIAGGRFTLADGTTSYLATFNNKGQLKDGVGSVAAPSSTVVSLEVHRGKVIIGGLFTSVAGKPRGEIAELNSDGSLTKNNFGGGADDGQVWLVDSDAKGSLLVGGNFSSMSGDPRTGVARFIRAS